ncbi:MAG: zinc ribbon domain-containing protein [Candidatus Subteraquimicrobiales bacterium]|nr:zinc ribbon domain-containing protein [Candidatus Subteraquimicrobiales bacterium]
MGYLVCEKCKGYYELEAGESAEDFDTTCACRGKLKYVKNLVDSESKTQEKLNKCPKCETDNPSNSTYCSECGVRLKTAQKFAEKSTIKKRPPTKKKSTTTNGGIMDFWDKQGTGAKVGIGIGGLCCIGIIFIVVLFGLFSGESSMSADQIKQNAQSVTPDTLYNDRGALVGKPVAFRGEVIQSSSGVLRIAQINIDQYGFNQGRDKVILVEGDTSGLTIYDKDVVDVYGIFKGQTSYTTVLGAEKQVPSVKQAIIVPTGQKVQN